MSEGRGRGGGAGRGRPQGQGRGRPQARLRKRLGRAIRSGHPWIFRDALERFVVPPGTVVDVTDERGRFCARGLAEEGPIAVRIFTTRKEELDEALLGERIDVAAQLRRRIVPPETDAYRLLHGEGDGVPGFVCDIYGSQAVLALDGRAAELWADPFMAALTPRLRAMGVQGLILRRGRKEQREVLRVWGPEAPSPLAISEHGMTLLTDLDRGQKTGLFLDHRESRARVGQLSAGLRVLNLYSYTGGFSVAAGRGGARRVDSVDVAPAAIDLADRSWRANDLDPGLHRGHAADVPDWLAGGGGPDFDLIVSDPPSFAPRRDAVDKAIKSYQALHSSCLKRLVPGGLYLAASCSSHITAQLFEQSLVDAWRAEGKRGQVLERWGAPADHPRALGFPEGDYLKVILARLRD